MPINFRISALVPVGLIVESVVLSEKMGVRNSKM